MNWMVLGFGMLLLVMGFIAYLMLGRKKDSAKTALGIFAVLGVLFAAGGLIVGDNFLAAGVTGPGGYTPPSGITAPAGMAVKNISSLVTQAKDELTGDYTSVDSMLKVYDKSADFKSSTAFPIVTQHLYLGTATTANPPLTTGTVYHVGFDGNSYYDMDLGEVYFVAPDSTDSAATVVVRVPSPGATGLSQVPPTGLFKVGTISDILDEAKQDTSSGGNTDVNFGYNDANELKLGGSNTLDINIAASDGQFKTRVVIAATGANTIIKNATLGFSWDSTNPPEGDEFNAISAVLVSGTDKGLVGANLLDAFKNRKGIVLGNLNGGDSASYDITWTGTKANWAKTTDSWRLCLDDLGTTENPIDQSDLFSGNTKATKNCTTFAFI